LQLYQSLPSAQVKKLFLSMEDDLVARYLQAMPTRQASKIIKEFETPEETVRLQAILERIRKSAPGAAGGGPAEPGPGGGPGTQGGATTGTGGAPGGSGTGGGPVGTGGLPNSASGANPSPAGADAERGAAPGGVGQAGAGR
jgi:hypothetical protein